jgi:predicted CXXCH cytochrome family protein
MTRYAVCAVTLALAACGGGSAPAPETAAAPKYVEAGACRDCHIEIWTSYMQTGMGRSFFRPSPENTVEAYDGIPYYHEASDRLYRMTRREGKFYQKRYQVGPADQDINVVEKEIHYVMGSGNHARTYLHQKPNGEIIELPLGWYSESGGKWRMSPGYDKRDHFGFQRLIAFDCMFCHNGFPEMAEGADFAGEPPAYKGRIPEGIDCQRCHGPGLPHLEALQRNAPPEEVASSIVNPARLAPERQMEVCYQCHLESTSRQLPNIVHRFGRGVFSYSPGEPLSDYALYFDHAAGSKFGDKFEINHSAYRLRKSRCFTESQGRLLCTTCHDPHGAPITKPQAQVCQGCHEGLTQVASHPKSEDCTSCHMPKRRTDDVVHAVMTDHYIQRRPPAGNLLAPKKEKHGEDVAYRGVVEPYYPESVREDYRALAQIAQDSNREAGIRALEGRDLAPEFLYELASARERAGDFGGAAATFERALAAKPEMTIARRRLGAALRQAGNLDRAEVELLQAARQDKTDSRIRKELGLVYIAKGRPEQAGDEFRAAIELDPELPENHNNLAGALLQLGREEQAEASFREAIRLQPDLAEANFGLGNLLAARGEIELAQQHWRVAIDGSPRSAAPRYNYAVTLIQQERWREAREQLEAAVEADPAMDAARLALGELLLAEGRIAEGRAHLERAAKSRDAAIQKAAQEALRQ